MIRPVPPTRERLLDAAERLIAERGFDGASLRHITQAAGVNLAAANYHFGSKDELCTAVLARRVEPMNRERLALLDQAEEQSQKRGPSLTRIVHALVAPPLLLSGTESGASALRLVGRLHAERPEVLQRLAQEAMGEVRRRFMAALARALPGLSRRELAWRMHFAIGVLINVMCDQHRLEILSDGLCSSHDVEGTLGELVPFLVAGFAASSSRAAPRAKRSKGGRR